MYSRYAGIVFGFHGCDKSVAEQVINLKQPLKQSNNDYDWLGNGVYFWENSPTRALEYANHLKSHPYKSKNPINEPAVIGAVIQLGHCFDLLDYENLNLLKEGYGILEKSNIKAQQPFPKNKKTGDIGELMLRELDCAVIETIHKARREINFQPFDSVRGVFWEGKELYPNAGFREKDHIQICIRNPNCIKGFFLPRELDDRYPHV